MPGFDFIISFIVVAVSGVWLLSNGLRAALMPRKVQKDAQRQRPEYWESIPILNLIWGWIDHPFYIPTVVVWGVLATVMGLLVLLMLIASIIRLVFIATGLWGM
ncbi:MAG: hypothetical protein HZB53_21545 [Chloroflexi bacterium]|nr:hypothetical protein [Chloroflexota bacterium]